MQVSTSNTDPTLFARYTNLETNNYAYSTYLGFNSNHPLWEPGDWECRVYSKMCGDNLNENELYSFEFTIDCCVAGDPPSVTGFQHPSDCNAADGGFRVLPSSIASNLPFNAFTWDVYDAAGNWYEPASSTGQYYGLTAGEYTLRADYDEASEELIESCDLPEVDITLGDGDLMHFTLEEETLSCTDEATGAVELEVIGIPGLEMIANPSRGTHTLAFVEAYGEEHIYRFTANQLSVGEHTFTFVGPNGECRRDYTHTVRAFTPTYASLRPRVQNDCGGEGSGSIELRGLPYGWRNASEITWDDGGSGNRRLQLTAGTYCYTIQDDCGGGTEGCVEVTDLASAFTYELAPRCVGQFEEEGTHDLSTMVVEHTGGPRPYFVGDIHTGQPYNTLTSERPRLFAAFGTHQDSCVRMIEADVPARSATVAFEESCFGEDAVLRVTLHAAPGDVVSASAYPTSGGREQEPVDVFPVANNTYQINLTTPAQGRRSLYVTVNGCAYEFQHDFTYGAGRDLVFVEYDDGTKLCEFQQVCHGDTLANAPYYQRPEVDWSSLDGNWLGKCEGDFRCGDVPIGTLESGNRTVSKIVYRMLYQQAERAQTPSLYPRALICDRFIGPGNNCDQIEYCPLTMEPFNRIQLPGNGSGTYIQENGCIHSSCGIGSREICPEDGFLPPGLDFDTDAAVRALQENHCAVRELTIAALLLYHDEWLGESAYAQSSLRREAERLISLYGANATSAGLHCAYVRYCEGSLSHISTESVDPFSACGQWIVHNQDCQANDPVLSSDPRPQCERACHVFADVPNSECGGYYVYCPAASAPTACDTCVVGAFDLHVVNTCIPDFSRAGTPWPEHTSGSLTPAGIEIAEQYAPHLGKGFITYRDTEGQRSPPKGHAISPFRAAIDMEPYDKTTAYDEYTGLLALDVNMSREYGTYVLQEDEPHKLRGAVEHAEASTQFTLSTAGEPIEYVATSCTAEQCYTLLKSVGALTLTADNDKGYGERKAGNYVLITDRTGRRAPYLKQLSEQANPTSLLATPTYLYVEGAGLAATLNLESGEWSYRETQSNTWSKVVPTSTGDAQRIAVTTSPDGKTEVSRQSLMAGEPVGRESFRITTDARSDQRLLVAALAADDREQQSYTLLTGVQTLTHERGEYELDPRALYALSTDDDSAETTPVAIATLDGAELIDVYPHVVDGFVYLQVEVPGSEDGGRGIARVNAYPIVNNGLYTQSVIVPVRADVLPAEDSDGSHRERLTLPDVAVSDLRVFPNPAADEVFVQSRALAGGASIEIVSAQGKRVLYIPGDIVSSERRKAIDTSRLPTGMYFVKVTSPAGTSQSERLIKQ